MPAPNSRCRAALLKKNLQHKSPQGAQQGGRRVKLTVLVDNNTLIDRYFLAEPGVCYYIESDGRKVLFDTGYSDVFIKNALKMGIDLLGLDMVVLSHAHLDHTWGLQHLIQIYAEQGFENKPVKRPALIAHPSVFQRRFIPGLGDIGSLVSEETAGRYFDLQLTRQPRWLHPGLVFLGQIERGNDFEAGAPIGLIRQDGRDADDFLLDDSALAFMSSQGLVIIAGCAHAGICNTVTRAMHVCGDQRLVDIIGGFPPAGPHCKTVGRYRGANGRLAAKGAARLPLHGFEIPTGIVAGGRSAGGRRGA